MHEKLFFFTQYFMRQYRLYTVLYHYCHQQCITMHAIYDVIYRYNVIYDLLCLI